MSANVIQHHKPRRKRAPARGWRISALIVAALGVMAASWLALEPRVGVKTPAPMPMPIQTAIPSLPPAPPELTEVDVAADLAGAPIRPTRRATARRSGISLDATGGSQSAGYEILSAAELDGISQARN